MLEAQKPSTKLYIYDNMDYKKCEEYYNEELREKYTIFKKTAEGYTRAVGGENVGIPSDDIEMGSGRGDSRAQ